MWKGPASVVCAGLSVLPRIGCAANVATTPQQAAVAPAAATGSTPYYAVGPEAPAAVFDRPAEPAPARSWLVKIPEMTTWGILSQALSSPALL